MALELNLCNNNPEQVHRNYLPLKVMTQISPSSWLSLCFTLLWKKKGDDHHLSAFCAKSAAHDFKDPPLFMILCTMSSEFTENLPLQFIAMLQKVNVL